jgi:hypothetical protein
MADYIDVFFKVGDAPGLLKDGQPVFYIDPDEWGYEPVLSEWMQRVFLCVRVPKTWKTKLLNVLSCVYVNPDLCDPDIANIKYVRAAYISFDEFATAINDPDLVSRLRGDSIVNIIDLRDKDITTAIFKDMSTHPLTEQPDYNAVTSGSYTVGSGGDYASWVAAFTDIGNLTGDLTFTQISATAETARITSAAQLNGYTFLATSTPHHLGSTSSNLISLNQNEFGFNIAFTNAGTSILDNLNIISAVALSTRYHSVSTSPPVGGIVTQVFSNLLVNKNLKIGSCIYCGAGHYFSLHNCNVWNQATSTPQNGGITFMSNAVLTSTVENCVSAGCVIGFFLNYDGTAAPVTLRNCIAVSNGLDYSGTATLTGYNNASQDTSADNANWATGSGNVTGRSVSDFKSVLIADPNFLDIVPTSDLVDAGTTNTLTRPSCIRGRTVPNMYGHTTIGSSEVYKPFYIIVGGDWKEIQKGGAYVDINGTTGWIGFEKTSVIVDGSFKTY